MNTQILKSGFLFLTIVSCLSFTSCEDQDLAKATIVVLQEHTAQQGQIYQTLPVEGAEVRVFSPVGPPELERLLITNSEGRAIYEYEYVARLMCDVSYKGIISENNLIVLDLGENRVTTVILPE